MKAITSNVRIAPKKLRVIAEIVRGMPAGKALDVLQFMPKKGAKIMYKAVASAVANATHNSNESAGALKLARVTVDRGIVYKRGQPISRGRTHSIIKPTCVLGVFLSK